MSKSFHENCRTRWTLSGGKELRKSLQSTAVYIDWMNRNLYEIGMKKRKKEKKRKENAFVVNITTVMAATWEFTHHTRRDRTWPLSTCEGFFLTFFFFLFCAPATPTTTTIIITITTTTSQHILVLLQVDDEEKTEKDATSLLFLYSTSVCKRSRARTHKLSLSFVYVVKT